MMSTKHAKELSDVTRALLARLQALDRNRPTPFAEDFALWWRWLAVLLKARLYGASEEQLRRIRENANAHFRAMTRRQ